MANVSLTVTTVSANTFKAKLSELKAIDGELVKASKAMANKPLGQEESVSAKFTDYSRNKEGEYVNVDKDGNPKKVSAKPFDEYIVTLISDLMDASLRYKLANRTIAEDTNGEAVSVLEYVSSVMVNLRAYSYQLGRARAASSLESATTRYDKMTTKAGDFQSRLNK